MSITCENIPDQIEINTFQRVDSGSIGALWGWSFRINELWAVWSLISVATV